VATALAVSCYYVLKNSEIAQGEVRFEAIADRALTISREIVQRKKLGAVSMADTASWFSPDVDPWPFVLIPGFEELAQNARDTSNVRSVGLCPFVTPEQLDEFEDFAYNYYQHTRDPPFPEGYGVSSFGPGVWQKGKTTNPDGKIPVNTDANNTWGSPHRLFAPILQHSHIWRVLMLNVNFEPTRGVMIDEMIQCSNERAKAEDPKSVPCGVLTDMLNLASEAEGSGPDAILMEPIYPAHDKTKLVGFIVSSVVWRESLENVFAADVTGVDCVLRTPNEIFTFEIQDGKAVVKGQGDQHDTKYDYYRRTIEIVSNGDFSPQTPTYTLEIYPTEEFLLSFVSQNPVRGVIGSLLIISVISCLFYLYDCYVRKEFDANKELLEAKRRFVRFVSHEVRTPLNTVCMGVALAREEISQLSTRPSAKVSNETPPDGPPADESSLKSTEEASKVSENMLLLEKDKLDEWLGLLGDISGNAESAVDVLNDLLHYDKIQRGKLNLELSIIPIWTMVEKTAMEFKLMAAEKGIKLTMDFSPLHGENDPEKSSGVLSLPERLRGCVVVGDEIRATQVLRNLISNALKFTPENGKLTVTARVEVAQEHSVKTMTLANHETISLPMEGQVMIDVTDTGIGMTKAQLKTVFNDSVQFNSNKLQGGKGSGLGLYIAKGIAEQHGGTLEVRSDGLNCGTTFTMVLPLYRDDRRTETFEGDSLADDRDHAPPPQQNILVVDDSAANRKLLIRLLQNRGHTCVEACDGREAVTHVVEAMAKATDGGSTEPFTTIVMDYEMPNMDGPTACQKIRSLGCSSFIVGVTGTLMPEDVAHFKDCGANAVLPKPFQMASLDQLWMEYGLS